MRWRVSGLTWLGGLLCLLLGCSRPSVVSLGPPWKLQVLRLGQLVKELDRSALQQLAAPENVTLFDPYYARQKRFVALPLEPILEAALGEPLAALRQRDFMLRAQDGYAVPLPGSRLLEGGAMLAVADLEVPAWEPIGPQRVNPGPLYLVWKHAHQTQQESHPRPWQLARIELVDAAQLYPHACPVDFCLTRKPRGALRCFVSAAFAVTPSTAKGAAWGQSSTCRRTSWSIDRRRRCGPTSARR
jgi:hypothetical protein